MNHPDYFAIGDTIKRSPVGAGVITGITEAGYPQVNHIAVTQLERTDGVIYAPHGLTESFMYEVMPEEEKKVRYL